MNLMPKKLSELLDRIEKENVVIEQQEEIPEPEVQAVPLPVSNILQDCVEQRKTPQEINVNNYQQNRMMYQQMPALNFIFNNSNVTINYNNR